MPTKLKKGRPATGETPKRSFRMADEDWDAAKRAAKLDDRPLSEHVRVGVVNETERVMKKHGK